MLIQAVRHQGLRMPVGGKLADAEIRALEEWVRLGAPWPDNVKQASSRVDRYADLVRSHWAYQKVNSAVPIPTESAKWSTNPVDRFVVSRLTQAGLSPAKRADRRTLIRRLTYVLTGLPPAASDVDQFVSNPSPNAYQDLVDRTMASPRYGEQWARHWLDLVRYAETRGYEWNYEIVGAWRYRDYLVRAFNADVPYDQLIREHIAGDLLEKPRTNTVERINESIIGTAFYRLGEAGHDDCTMFREIALDVVDSQIDTVTRAFQGMTVSCARCHNHKLDPIPTEDYYGLYSVLNSSRAVTHTIDLPNVNEKPLLRLRSLKREIQTELAGIWKAASKQIAVQISSALRPQDDSGSAETTKSSRAWKAAIAGAGEKPEDQGYPIARLLCETGSQERWIPEAASRLAEYYQQEQSKRAAFNRDNFQRFGPESWQASGNGLNGDRALPGNFGLTSDGDKILSSVVSSGLYTQLLSSRLNGALRSPYLPKDKKYISLRVAGGNLAARRTVIDNCAIGETYKVLENDRPQWIRLDTLAAQANLPVFVELVTRWDNPRIPDRPDVLKPHQLQLLKLPRSWFGITDAVLHDTPETPRENLGFLLPLFDGGPITDLESLAASYQRVIGQAIDHWAANASTDDDARWLDWLVKQDLLPNRVDASARLSTLVSEYRSIESEIPEPRVVEGLSDAGGGRSYPVLIGGNPKNPGKPAPRQFLSRILQSPAIQNEGRGGVSLLKPLRVQRTH